MTGTRIRERVIGQVNSSLSSCPSAKGTKTTIPLRICLQFGRAQPRPDAGTGLRDAGAEGRAVHLSPPTAGQFARARRTGRLAKGRGPRLASQETTVGRLRASASGARSGRRGGAGGLLSAAGGCVTGKASPVFSPATRVACPLSRGASSCPFSSGWRRAGRCGSCRRRPGRVDRQRPRPTRPSSAAEACPQPAASPPFHRTPERAPSR
mmetsp:Transcript_17685/g.62881  ORF Transcript_17685/g.62881 Transcript_17685/m.62881 type:complete len:209 (+) Transcript_17685:1076-1702(+)